MKQDRYVVCTSCDAMNPSFEQRCDQCGASISASPADEATQPTDAVAGVRFRRPSTLRLIGIWSLALPNVVAGPFLAVLVLKHMHGLAGFIMLWGDVGLTGLWLFLFYRVTRSYFSREAGHELATKEARKFFQ